MAEVPEVPDVATPLTLLLMLIGATFVGGYIQDTFQMGWASGSTAVFLGLGTVYLTTLANPDMPTEETNTLAATGLLITTCCLFGSVIAWIF
jgi:hypothetical protein